MMHQFLFASSKREKALEKSALLRRTKTLAEKRAAKNITLWCKGTDIRPDVSQPSVSANLVDAWTQKICTRINREIGARIKLATTDDAMTLVEASELDGFRARNIVSALADRMKIQLSAGTLSIGPDKLLAANDVALLERFSKDADYIFWMFVDDIDATFQNNEQSRAVLGSFFTACRDLVQKVKGLVIRCAVRTDVWTIVHAADEAMDKCEQYVYNLRWDNEGVAEILENKVYAYFTVTEPLLVTLAGDTESKRKTDALSKIFPSNYKWGRDRSISRLTFFRF